MIGSSLGSIASEYFSAELLPTVFHRYMLVPISTISRNYIQLEQSNSVLIHFGGGILTFEIS